LPRGRCVPRYVAHVARVSHDMLYQFILFTWSEWIAICCPCGQSVA